MKSINSKLIALGCLALLACQNDEITSQRVPKAAVSMSPHASMAPAPAAPMGGGSDMGSAEGLELPSQNHGLHWKAPASWVEEPASQMRVGSFKAKDAQGRVADISVVPLSGVAGGLTANVNRWRGQIQLAPLSEAELKTQIKTIQPNGLNMTYVEFFNQGRGLAAAIYEKGAQTWFFKMTGEDQAVKNQKDNFQKFLTELHFHE